MSDAWKRWATRIAHSVERTVDETRSRIGGPGGARRVIAYRGFGSTAELFVSGRVLANAPASHGTAADAWWRNLRTMLRHLESDEVPGARVHLSIAGTDRETVADEEGFFRLWIRPSHALPPTQLWHTVDIRVIEPLHPAAAELRAAGPVLVPQPAARFGVISDIDDTVIRTDATRLISMLRRTFLENARTRLPFAGVAEFYRGLHTGDDGTDANPIFYVSSSPWNLYDLLTEFLTVQSIPLGPLMLRDWGLSDRGFLPRAHGEHKLGAIRQIMETLPELPFILIGDSGQEDPEIYRDIVHAYRRRIHAVYIRNVTADPARARAIGELAEEVQAAGSELLLSDDTLAAAKHAAERAWVGPETIRRVAAAVSSSAARPD